MLSILKKPPKKITDPVAQFLALATDPERFQAFKDEIDAKIARLEELTGIYKTIEQAQAYEKSALEDRESASRLLESAKVQAANIKVDAEQQAKDTKAQAEAFLDDARRSKQESDSLLGSIGADLRDREKALEKREKDIARREVQAAKAIEENERLSQTLKAKVNAIERIVSG